MSVTRGKGIGRNRGSRRIAGGAVVAGLALHSGVYPGAAEAAILHCDGAAQVGGKVASIAYDFWLPSTESSSGEGTACIAMEGDADQAHWSDVGSIAVLQRALRQCEGQAIDVDGKFGTRTRAAVKRTQRKYHLKPDGVYGPLTARHMLWYGSRIGSPVCVRLAELWPRRVEPTSAVRRRAARATTAAAVRAQGAAMAAKSAERAEPSAVIDFGPFRMTSTDATLVETWRERVDGGPLDHSLTVEASEDEYSLTLTLTGTNAPSDTLMITLSDAETRWTNERGAAALMVGDRSATLQLTDVKLRNEEGSAALGPMSGHVHGPLVRHCMVIVGTQSGHPVWQEDADWSSAPCRSVQR